MNVALQRVVLIALAVLAALAVPARAAPSLGMHEGAVNACDNTERWTHSRAGDAYATHVAPANYPATAVDMGTGGGDAWWRALNVGLVRWSPPWDIALPRSADAKLVTAHDPNRRWAALHAGALRREQECMDWWLNVALQDHETVDIAFKPDYDYRDPKTNHVLAPDLRTYAKAMRAFVAQYVNCPTASAGYCVPRSHATGGPGAATQVRVITPWGEPDFEGRGPRGNYERSGRPGHRGYVHITRANSRIYLADESNPFGGSQTCRTLSTRDCGPVLAAHMWTTVARDCGRICILPAADCTSAGCTYPIGGAGAGRSYLDLYRRSLGAARPPVWGVHPYTDASNEEWCLRNTGADYNPAADPGNSVTEHFLAAVHATVWLDEVSVWAVDRSLHTSSRQPINVNGQPCGVNSTAHHPTYTPAVEAAAFQWLYSKLGALPGVSTLVYFRAFTDNPGYDISPTAAPGSNEAALYQAIVNRQP